MTRTPGNPRTPVNPRNITLTLLALAFLCTAAAGPCFALIGVQDVTPEMAKELDVVVRAQRTGSQIYVWLEFKPEGKMKDFGHAQLTMADGERSLSVTLRPLEQTAERIKLFFSANPATVPACTVMIVVRNGGAARSGIGYVFKMKDHVDVKGLLEEDKAK